jgi:hypothetical protein
MLWTFKDMYGDEWQDSQWTGIYVWKEAVVAKFVTMLRHVHGEYEKNHKTQNSSESWKLLMLPTLFSEELLTASHPISLPFLQ